MPNEAKKRWSILVVREDATPVTDQVDAVNQGAAFEAASKILRDPFYRAGPRARVFMSCGEGLLEYSHEEVTLWPVYHPEAGRPGGAS